MKFLCIGLLWAASLCGVASIQAAAPLSPSTATSFRLQNIKIQGNTRIERETILSLIDLAPGRTYSYDELDGALKKLYASGYFGDAALKLEGSTLVIDVKENPIVNQLQIENNSKISDDILKSELQLRPRQIYTLSRLRHDTQRLQDIYRLKGHFAAVVTPEIIKRDQNRVDVVFNVQEGEATVVRRIFFIGNRKFDSSKLQSTIQTRESRWYLALFTSDDTFDQDRLAYDRELLRKFYLEHGYADFQVKSAVAELTPDQKEFFITFTVQEGERYKVGKVNIQSALKKLNIEALKSSLLLSPGEWYSSKDLERTITALTDALGDMGYAFVDIQPQIEKDGKTRTLSLNFVIQEGPKVYVNKIHIEHNDRTDDEVIRREMRLKEGDAFNTNALKNSEKRIKDLGFFKKVIVNRVPGNAPDLIDLVIDVEEDRTAELSLGAGFSTTDGPLIDAKFVEHNFRGKGQDLRANVTLAKRRQEYDLGFTEPYFMNRELAAGFDLYRVTRHKYQDARYDQEINGFSVNLGYQLSEFLSQVVGYRLQMDNIKNIGTDASIYQQAQKGSKLLSAVTQEIAYDRRDSRIEPTQGYVLGFSNDFAGIGGSIKYLKNQLRGAYHYPVADDTVATVWARYGYMIGLGGNKTRIVDRYVLGGDSLRGFEPGGVGPHDLKTGDLLGGKQTVSGGVEVTFPLGLPNEFGMKGVAFSEAGSVSKCDEKGPQIYDQFKLRWVVGVGLKWKSPVGPIKINVAQPISKAKSDRTQIVSFGIITQF